MPCVLLFAILVGFHLEFFPDSQSAEGKETWSVSGFGDRKVLHVQTVALTLQKSHLIDMSASHLTAFQHLEMRRSEHACPSPFEFH